MPKKEGSLPLIFIGPEGGSERMKSHSSTSIAATLPGSSSAGGTGGLTVPHAPPTYYRYSVVATKSPLAGKAIYGGK